MPEPVLLTSTIGEVVVYRQGALVTRVVELPPEGWPERVVVDGLPLALDDESLRVSVRGEGGASLPRPADVRTELAVPEAEAPPPPPREELEAAARRVEDLRRKLSRVEEEIAQVERVELKLPEEGDDRPVPPTPLAAWEGALDWIAEQRQARAEERLTLRDALSEAQEDLARLKRDAEWARAHRSGPDVGAASKRVTLRLRGEGRGPGRLLLEYRVPGARWLPTYVLRLSRDGRSASLGLRAHVVQASGEAWERVRLGLSTANLSQETRLPELSSLRIGRRQPEPARRAWREPPRGAEVLFEGLDRMRPPPAPTLPEPLPTPVAPPPPQPRYDEPAVMESALDDMVGEDYCLADEPEPCDAEDDGAAAFGAPPAAKVASESYKEAAPVMKRRAMAPAPSMAMPAGPAGAAFPAPKGGRGGGGGAAPPRPPEPRGIDPAGDLLSYGELQLGAWDAALSERGKLRARSWVDRVRGLDAEGRGAMVRRLQQAVAHAQAAASVALPANTTAPEASSGAYDYRYDAEGRVDVPCDGALHNVPLLTREAPVETTLVVVPRESDQAVRVAHLSNPLEAPLLAGPAEVYLEDEFLVTTRLLTVPSGGKLEVGLGIEPGLKVARNAHLREETHGLLGGGRSLIHSVEVDLGSRLRAEARLDVRERLPVPADEDERLQVTDVRAEPAWEEWSPPDGPALRGGRRWLLTLPPGEERRLSFSYTIKIDGKDELVGGDRRE